MTKFQTALLLLSALPLAGCSRDFARPSNLAVTDDDAKQTVGGRLDEQNQVRGVVGNVRRSLRPVEKVLDDATVQLTNNPSITGRAVPKLAEGFHFVDSMLRDVFGGLTRYRADGSWYVQRDVPIKLGGCARPTIELAGRKAASETFSLAVLPCGGTRTEVVNIDVADKTFKALLHLNAVRALANPSGTDDGDATSCRMKLEGGKTELDCDPIPFGIGPDLKLIVSPLHESIGGGNVTGELSIQALGPAPANGAAPVLFTLPIQLSGSVDTGVVEVGDDQPQ